MAMESSSPSVVVKNTFFEIPEDDETADIATRRRAFRTMPDMSQPTLLEGESEEEEEKEPAPAAHPRKDYPVLLGMDLPAAALLSDRKITVKNTFISGQEDDASPALAHRRYRTCPDHLPCEQVSDTESTNGTPRNMETSQMGGSTPITHTRTQRRACFNTEDLRESLFVEEPPESDDDSPKPQAGRRVRFNTEDMREGLVIEDSPTAGVTSGPPMWFAGSGPNLSLPHFISENCNRHESASGTRVAELSGKGVRPSSVSSMPCSNAQGREMQASAQSPASPARIPVSLFDAALGGGYQHTGLGSGQLHGQAAPSPSFPLSLSSAINESNTCAGGFGSGSNYPPHMSTRGGTEHLWVPASPPRNVEHASWYTGPSAPPVATPDYSAALAQAYLMGTLHACNWQNPFLPCAAPPMYTCPLGTEAAPATHKAAEPPSPSAHRKHGDNSFTKKVVPLPQSSHVHFGQTRSLEGTATASGTNTWDMKTLGQAADQGSAPQRNARRLRLWAHIYLHMQVPGFDLVPRIIGRGGGNMRKIAEATGAKLRVRGRGSGHLEIDGKSEAPTPLMVAVTTDKGDESGFRAAIEATIKELQNVEVRFRTFCEKNNISHDGPCYSMGVLSDSAKACLGDLLLAIPQSPLTKAGAFIRDENQL